MKDNLREVGNVEQPIDMGDLFSEELWYIVVDRLTLYSNGNMVFTLTSGKKVVLSNCQQ